MDILTAPGRWPVIARLVIARLVIARLVIARLVVARLVVARLVCAPRRVAAKRVRPVDAGAPTGAGGGVHPGAQRASRVRDTLLWAATGILPG